MQQDVKVHAIWPHLTLCFNFKNGQRNHLQNGTKTFGIKVHLLEQPLRSMSATTSTPSCIDNMLPLCSDTLYFDLE